MEVLERCPSHQRERDMMRSGSQNMAKALRASLGLDWPCGHARTPETTHTVAGVESCRVCRRARWRAGFLRAAIRAAANEERRCLMAESMRRVGKAGGKDRQRKIEDIVASFKGRLPLAELIFCVAASFDMTPADLRGPCRIRHCVHARAVVSKILHERGCSYPQIGKFLGERDHSTVIHAVGSWDMYTKRDPRVLDAYLTFGDAA